MKADHNNILLHSVFHQRSNSAYTDLDGSAVTLSQVLNHAFHVSRQLPDRAYAVNLCRDRYLFTVAYMAVIIKNQINLLPPNQAPQTINRIMREYRQSYCLTDSSETGPNHAFVLDGVLPAAKDGRFPHFNPDRTVSIAFTSGSTGTPKAIKKTWREFQQSAALAIQCLGLSDKNYTFIATVPAQHMYGLETSVFWPFFSNNRVSRERPFYPEDIRQLALACDTPCLLISTPTHLQACVNAGLKWRNIGMVLSSTAPMPTVLAEQIETHFNAPLFEIFGSTETLSYASRRPTQNHCWKPYPGIALSCKRSRFSVGGGHLAEPVLSDDYFQLNKDGSFTVSGRTSDLIKIAGKRASLGELNRIINAVPGVEEAVYFCTGSERLAAMAVSRLTKQEILFHLKQSIDEVFLPRPITIVRQLPRNEVGKIIKAGLEQAFEEPDIA